MQITRRRALRALAGTALAAGAGLSIAPPALAADIALLNVSYDPTRELYKAINPAFACRVESEDRRCRHGPVVARGVRRPGAR